MYVEVVRVGDVLLHHLRLRSLSEVQEDSQLELEQKLVKDHSCVCHVVFSNVFFEFVKVFSEVIVHSLEERSTSDDDDEKSVEDEDQHPLNY